MEIEKAREKLRDYHFSFLDRVTMKMRIILVLFILIFASLILGAILTKKFSGNAIEISYSAENDDLVRERLPGQPHRVTFKQYAGNIVVDELKERVLFYYFVEAALDNPTSRPLLLWLNGGPGCSSLGNGAFIEHGPFGVQSNGRTLYERKKSWNKLANVLYLESPAGVGFSYSNTSTDYNTTTDLRTAQDSYMFIMKWFEKFPLFRNCDFHIAGESYGGFYVPELADLIVQKNLHVNASLRIQLKGIMVGNGMIDPKTDERGIYEYLWSHALISDETYEGLIKTCIETESSECMKIQKRLADEEGTINAYRLYHEDCGTSKEKKQYDEAVDPCERKYVRSYLNLIQVQRSLHVSRSRLPYKWELCSFLPWSGASPTMIPVYKKLISARIHILVYSGDLDAVIPVTGTRYSLQKLNLTIKNSWKPWFDDTKQVAGYKVEYNGLDFMTVYGAGHEVPRFSPAKAFSMLKLYLEKYKV